MRLFLRRLLDRKRCRYFDCPGRHPAAKRGERISCPLCRSYMGLMP